MSIRVIFSITAFLLLIFQIGTAADLNVTVQVVVPIEDSSEFVNISPNRNTIVNTSNTTLELTASENASGTIDILLTSVPVDIPSLGVPSLNKYLKIEAAEQITDSMDYVFIKLFYSDEEISASGLEEGSLCLYWWNQTISTWEKLTPDMDWVYDAGVDTVDNYVWANVTHFSDYGIGGAPQSLKITRTYPAEVETNQKFDMNLMLKSLVEFDLVNVFISEKIPKEYKIDKKKIFPEPIFINNEKDFTVIYWWVRDLKSHSELDFSYSVTSPRNEGIYFFNAESLGFDSSFSEYNTTIFSKQEVKQKSLIQNIMEILKNQLN